MKTTIAKLIPGLPLLAVAVLLSACTPSRAPIIESQVAQAFESSSTSLSFKPYTRTIFSSNDF